MDSKAGSGGTDHFLTANGLRFHYLEWGSADAPPLLLLHGFGNQAHIWDEFAGVVSARYRVIAPDSRGHGDSDHAETYGHEINALDTAAVLSALRIERLSLVGFSMGGINAVLFSASHPGNVERLVIVDTGPEIDPRGLERLRRTVGKARSVFGNREETLAYIRLANPRMSEDLVIAALGFAFREQPDGSYALKYDSRLRDSFAQESHQHDDLWPLLESIPCPCLIVRGGDSDLFADSTAKKMVARMRDARLETVPGAGHTVMVDNPDGFNSVVGAFL